MSGGEKKSAWIVRSVSSETPWGEETVWRSPSTVSVKTLALKKGKRNSFKYNKLKDELLICAHGRIKAYYGSEPILSGDGDLQVEELRSGMALAVQSNCPYRLEALSDSIVLEVSTSRISTIDVARLHDDYGRETEELTPHMEEVVKKWFLT
jgi:mannose-6-phosphate isomerase-like protein (cupin superfamily)